jgi:hypothetical protein
VDLFKLAEGKRQFKMHVFVRHMTFFNGGGVAEFEVFNDGLDEVFRRRGAGGDEDGVYAVKPVVIDLRDIIDEMAAHAAVLGDFNEALGIGAVLAADNQDHIAMLGELLDGGLAVGGGVADVFFLGAVNIGIFDAQGGDDGGGIIQRKSGLCEVGDLVVNGDGKALHVFDGFDNRDVIRGFAKGADDFVMVFMAYEDDGIELLRKADGFHVDFGDQRAGGIDLYEIAGIGGLADFRAYAVGGVDDGAAWWDLINGIDENDALGGEAIDHVAVVNDFMVDIYRSAFKGQNAFDAFNGHVDAGAEAAGVGEKNFHRHAEAFHWL